MTADKARKRAARQRAAATGESYTRAARLTATSTSTDAAPWTWEQAADRLDALADALHRADALLDQLAELDRHRSPVPHLPGQQAMRNAAGGTRGGLTGAIRTLLEDLDLDPLQQARSGHLHWYAEQAYRLMVAAAADSDPVEVPAPAPAPGESGMWDPPVDAVDVATRAGTGGTLHLAVIQALGAIGYALGAADELDDWSERIMDDHLESCQDSYADEDGYGDGRCYHSPGPADHEFDHWVEHEDQACTYDTALAGFCEAARLLIHARAAALTPAPA